ncbi:MAG: adenosylcobinamide-GDP ribazoletransferase [Solirubrobacterales bacterium]
MMEGFIFSLQFLTRIPINKEIEINKINLGRSTFFFPYTGMIIGGISALMYSLGLYFGRDIGAMLGLLSLIFITGGLHIDGLSDTCDGFFSSRNRERILEIMKDSHSGTFGVIAVVLDIFIKYILLSKITGNPFACLMLSCGNARLVAVMLMCFTKPARSSGMGVMFSDNLNKKYFYFGFISYVVLTALLFNYKYLAMLLAALVAAILTASKSYKTIGGLTGDVYGASIELCEMAGIAAFLGVSLWI